MIEKTELTKDVYVLFFFHQGAAPVHARRRTGASIVPPPLATPTGANQRLSLVSWPVTLASRWVGIGGFWIFKKLCICLWQWLRTIWCGGSTFIVWQECLQNRSFLMLITKVSNIKKRMSGCSKSPLANGHLAVGQWPFGSWPMARRSKNKLPTSNCQQLCIIIDDVHFFRDVFCS